MEYWNERLKNCMFHCSIILLFHPSIIFLLFFFKLPKDFSLVKDASPGVSYERVFWGTAQAVSNMM